MPFTILYQSIPSIYEGGDPKHSRIVTKNLFKIFIQVLNFSPLQSTPPVTEYSDPNAAPSAGNVV